MKLSTHEIAYVVLNAGFNETMEAPTMVAIILATSGGDTDYLEFVPVDDRQDQLHGLAALGSIKHTDQLLMGNWRDAQINANMAYSLFSTTNRNFTNWEAFTTGSYKKWLPLAYFGTENPVKPLSNAALKADENGDLLSEMNSELQEMKKTLNSVDNTTIALSSALAVFGKAVTEIRSLFRS